MSCCFAGLAGLTKPKKSGKLTFGYWGIRGLAASFRMALEYAGADYEDKQYTDGEKWFKEDKKAILEKNAFANLPYLKDGDVVVCQTNAIFEYLGDRFGLNGKTAKQRLLNAQALAEVYDLRNEVISLVYSFQGKVRDESEFQQKFKKHLTEGYKKAYQKLENFIKQNGGCYSCGSNICMADFHLFEMLDQHELYGKHFGDGTLLTPFPALSKFYEKFKAEPKLKKYFASASYKLPCNNPPYSFTKEK